MWVVPPPLSCAASTMPVPVAHELLPANSETGTFPSLYVATARAETVGVRPSRLEKKTGAELAVVTVTFPAVVSTVTWLGSVSVKLLLAAYVVAMLTASDVSVAEVQMTPAPLALARQFAAASAAASAATCAWWCFWYQVATSIARAAITMIRNIAAATTISDWPSSPLARPQKLRWDFGLRCGEAKFRVKRCIRAVLFPDPVTGWRDPSAASPGMQSLSALFAST